MQVYWFMLGWVIMFGILSQVTAKRVCVEVREVSLDGKYAIVNMDDSVKEEELKALIEDLGFQLIAIQ